ncbi:MAG TPA: rod shape-determining protein RodA [Candidatus Moranbacteria bacterium]|nr:rod shape-determining protein RodA [Candidatus Moranbacteria bacterium]
MLRIFRKTDWLLLAAAMLLLGISLAVLYSISRANPGIEGMSVFGKQAMYAALGMGVMLALSQGNYQHLKRMGTPIYFATLGVLVLVLVFGKPIRGTVGWIGVGPFHIQPVEMAKLSLIIFLASFISQKKMELGEVGRIIASVILSLAMIALVMKQPDFGSAMVLAGIWAIMLFVSGISRKTIAVLVLVGLIVAGGVWSGLADYQRARIMTVFDPAADARGSGYNVNQAMIAIGSGGFLGKGIGHGSQSNLNFLPEKHTDFIFAVVGEELGLVGSLAVISLFSLLFMRIRIIARSAPDNFGYLLATGIFAMFFLHFVENIGMNMGVLPVTGIPLPLLSYGGSSLIAAFSALGLLLSIWSRREHTLEVAADPY